VIAIVVPTRGMVFTETVQEIANIQNEYETKVYYSWDKIIPDSNNYLVKKALDNSPEYLLFIEEDVVIPKGAVKDLIDANAAIACIDYGVNGYSCIGKSEGRVLWCGLGCTLVKREVFEKLPYPWFRTDQTFRLNDHQWTDAPAKYGGHDIYFTMKAREAGFEIKQVEGECKHLQLDELGRKEWNDGLHKISEKDKISKNQEMTGF